jgi:trehalose 6-phosphate synthase/phosphatase
MPEMKKFRNRRLVVVSNRLPIVVSKENGWTISPSAGGLVTAMAPVLRHFQGLWVGWPGCSEEAPIPELFARFSAEYGYHFEAVPLTAEEVENYYHGFSNETLWPLFHDLLGHCRFNLENRLSYGEVNRRFAEAVAGIVNDDDFIWVHDYQLLEVGSFLKSLAIKLPLAFFLHVPFPSPDLFRRLPWKKELILAMLHYDLLGFQTLRDRRNFVHTARELIPELEADIHRRYTLLQHGKRQVKVAHFPISIDFDEFNDLAQSKEVADAAWYLHEHYGDRQLILGIDRLDYTKGIPERFLAFERALEKYPELRRQVSLIQVVVPSRTLVAEYQNLREILDGLAGRINSRFSEQGWVPIHYFFRSLDRVQLLGHYRASEIALVSPLRDGMNLVAKEYCASSVDGNGVLILSEFAGAADQLGKGALLVNPYDLDGTADAIHQAFTMPLEERRRRLKWLRTEIRRSNVYRWVEWFLAEVENGHFAGNKRSR